MKYWFTSDFHLGHFNIIRYCDRPFKSLKQMNETLIKRFNERVNPEDLVFFLGDFCLSGDSYIDTPIGRKQIRTLKVGDTIYSFNFKNKQLESSKITKTWKTESKSRLHILLENNFIIKVTKNHPFAVSYNGKLKWTLAKDLQKGNILFRRKDIPAKMYQLKKQEKSYMLGYILGYSYGDGSFNQYNIDIQSKDFDGLKRIIKYIQKLYKRKLKIKKDKYYRLKIPYDIYNSLKTQDFTYKKINTRYPKWYYGFLAGFFDAEGNCTYQNHNWYIRMGSTNKNLFKFVYQILMYFNFDIIKEKIKKSLNYKTYYSLKLLTKETFKYFIKTKPAIKRKYPNLKILANGIKIKKITKIYPKYKKFINYNLTVEPNNNYFVKGILVHNCFKNSKNSVHRGEGDIHNANYYKEKLNCKNIVFCKGNHDRNNSLRTPIERLVIRLGGKRINLVHNPAHVDLNYEINFVGHIHQLWKFKRIKKGLGYTDLINVGVDVNKFYPVSFEEIMKTYYRWIKQGAKNGNKF